jgi:hypothetical protein
VDDKRVLLPLALAALIVGTTASSLAAGTPKPTAVRSSNPLSAHTVVRSVSPRVTRRLRAATWRWEVVMGRRRSRLAAPLNTRKALEFWRHRVRSVRRLAAHPPHRAGWLCIHHYEGNWRDSGDPYWGGLQMDRGFMRAYAPRVLLRRGWADRWTPLEQMWVAERAHRGRGFSPWPNTAGYCGLL